MVIVSQDRRKTINFDNVNYVEIIEDGEYYIGVNYDDDFLSIGEYKTEERAKEVLQEIVTALVTNRKAEESEKIFGFSMMIPSNAYYEMPEE